MKKIQLLLALVSSLLLFASCGKENQPQMGASYPDGEVFTSLIPYPCTDWGTDQKGVEVWERAHGGTLNEKMSQEYSTSKDLFLWFDVNSKTNPVRGYYISRSSQKMVQAVGYYDPCTLLITEDGQGIVPAADALLVKNYYEYSGLVANGFFQYTSSKLSKIIRIARVDHNNKVMAYVNYSRKP